MKNYFLISAFAILSVSCNGQEIKTEIAENNTSNKNSIEAPKGSWKVDKEFDEQGNLIRYDSIYSWSSDSVYKNLSAVARDSLIQSFKSSFFTNFSSFEDDGFDKIFSKDSLFSQRFFNDDFFKSDFGKDYIDIDRIGEEMMERQRQFLKKYQSEFLEIEEGN